MRRSVARLIGMNFGRTQVEEASSKKSWTELFWKPKTRDEAVKDYVPEVLEESLAEQRAVLAQQTTRDVIVEHGHKILREMENKAPTPSIFPALNKILSLYGPDHIISQRALNLLLYPGSAPQFQQSQAPELIANFQEHFKNFLDAIEQNGSYHHDTKLPLLEQLTKEAEAEAAKAQGESPTLSTSTDEQASTDEAAAAEPKKKIEVPKPEAEPLDITYFVKCVAAMTLANLQIGDTNNALRCCDAALLHVIDDTRRGGVLALKSGVLIQLKRYDEAIEAAKLSIAACPNNAQAYLQGATAMRLLRRTDDAIALLAQGTEACPGNDSIQALTDSTNEYKAKEAERLAKRDESAGQVIDDGKRKRVRRLQLAQ